MDIICIRHAPTNTPSRVLKGSQTGYEIQDIGQIATVGEDIEAQYDIDWIVTSKLQRAIETSLVFAHMYSIQPIVIGEFRGMDFGVATGHSASSYIEENPRFDKDKAGVSALHERFPDGESVVDVYFRIMEGLQQIYDQYSGTGLLVSHRIPLAIMYALATDEGIHLDPYTLDNLDWFVINFDGEEISLVENGG